MLLCNKRCVGECGCCCSARMHSSASVLGACSSGIERWSTFAWQALIPAFCFSTSSTASPGALLDITAHVQAPLHEHESGVWLTMNVALPLLLLLVVLVVVFALTA